MSQVLFVMRGPRFRNKLTTKTFKQTCKNWFTIISIYQKPLNNLRKLVKTCFKWFGKLAAGAWRPGAGGLRPAIANGRRLGVAGGWPGGHASERLAVIFCSFVVPCVAGAHCTPNDILPTYSHQMIFYLHILSMQSKFY